MTENKTNFTNNSMKIAVLQARWFADIVDEARISFVDKMSELTNDQAVVDVFDIPGAFEAPLLAKKLAKTGNYDAIVVTAFVTDGGIYRHEFVADAVISGIMQVQLETEVPVLSVSLTPHHYQGGAEQHAFFFNHFKKKGVEAAEATYMTVNNLRQTVTLKEVA
ncbi:MAG: 6,7-dimethyl-8-ribityllumazine synthase [Alphaproteobacteria bacterium]|nr:6,7-dimethyl-8-ribityllumazine synthase [Alphaproteobacteria bacterium]